MVGDRKYAVVIMREDGRYFVLVPSADQRFCEETAKQFNATADRAGEAFVAQLLVW